MASQDAQQLIGEVLGEFIAAKKSFTLLDISREVQKRLGAAGKPIERHMALHDDEEAEVYAQLQQNPDWERTLIQIPGVPVNPQLYHPVTSDPQDYVNAVLAARGSLRPGAVTVPVAAGSPGRNGGVFHGTSHAGAVAITTGPATKLAVKRAADPGNRPVGRRGRLIVARKILAAVGIKHPGQVVTVALSPAKDAILLTTRATKLDPAATVVHKLKVDVEGRIRINPKFRRKVGVDGQRFVIKTVDDHAVEVRPA